MKLIASNKKAYHDYFVLEKYECGIELKGTEVKSIRVSGVSLKESVCRIKNLECFVIGMHINPYEKGNIFNVDPMRTRRLLLHKKQIKKIFDTVKLQGYTIVPLQIYFKDDKVKLELGLCKGKKLYDVRETIKKKDIKRNLEKKFKAASIKI